MTYNVLGGLYIVNASFSSHIIPFSNIPFGII